MEKVAKKVVFGARNKPPFVFCGARYDQKDNEVTVDLEDYVKEIELVPLTSVRKKEKD